MSVPLASFSFPGKRSGIARTNHSRVSMSAAERSDVRRVAAAAHGGERQ